MNGPLIGTELVSATRCQSGRHWLLVCHSASSTTLMSLNLYGCSNLKAIGTVAESAVGTAGLMRLPNLPRKRGLRARNIRPERPLARALARALTRTLMAAI